MRAFNFGGTIFVPAEVIRLAMVITDSILNSADELRNRTLK